MRDSGTVKAKSAPHRNVKGFLLIQLIPLVRALALLRGCRKGP